MKPGDSVEDNRLDGSVMQQVEHQNNMGMGMMDPMVMNMPMMMPTSGQQPQQQPQQMTSVPMDQSGNVGQAVPGPSAQTSHEQIPQQKVDTNQDDDEEESDDEENSDDECDGDDGKWQYYIKQHLGKNTFWRVMKIYESRNFLSHGAYSVFL